MATKATHGGAGRGQGRKPLDPSEPTVRITVRLSQSQLDWLKGKDANVSEALRELIHACMTVGTR